MWQEILKARGLIDPKKLKQAMDLDKKPQFAGLGKRIPKEGRYSDDGEYADVTDNRILDVEFEKKAIRVKGDITVDGKTIPFSVSQSRSLEGILFLNSIELTWNLLKL